jgi:hypothetical protein
VPEHLERDPTIMLDVVGEIHNRHSAGPELPLDAIAIGEGGGE